MSGALGKKLGLVVVSAKDDARGRVYRIAVPAWCAAIQQMAQTAGHSDKHTSGRQSASRNSQISTWQQKVHAATEKRLAAEI